MSWDLQRLSDFCFIISDTLWYFARLFSFCNNQPQLYKELFKSSNFREAWSDTFAMENVFSFTYLLQISFKNVFSFEKFSRFSFLSFFFWNLDEYLHFQLEKGPEPFFCTYQFFHSFLTKVHLSNSRHCRTISHVKNLSVLENFVSRNYFNFQRVYCFVEVEKLKCSSKFSTFFLLFFFLLMSHNCWPPTYQLSGAIGYEFFFPANLDWTFVFNFDLVRVE